MTEFEEMLNEPKNTLGRTEEVVELVKKDVSRIDELFALYFQDDEWVKLRVSSVLKRLWRWDPKLIEPFLDDWIGKVSKLDQPSVQWTFAQMVEECRSLIKQKDLDSAINQVKRYLDSDDWIVLNNSIQTLGTFAKENTELAKWLMPKLDELATDKRKSVAKRAVKVAKVLAKRSKD